MTQFFGAFNDNVLKQALALMFVFGGLIAQGANAGIYVNLAAGLLILPFFLFSATAGSLADKVEKSRLIRMVKLGEIGVAALAGLALYLQSVPALLAVLFLLGTQSAFFGPLKYAILPQHLDTRELVGGNAVVQMGTFAAILLGTIIGGVVGARAGGSALLFVMVVGVAVAGYLACRAIPRAPSTHAGPVGFNPVAETRALITLARERKAVFQSILGVSWFWLLGSVNLAQMAALVPDHLAGGPSVVTLILILFTVAIAVGALLCERLSGRRVEIGLVPLGALGVSVFGIDGYFAVAGIEGDGLRSAWEFLGGEGTPRLLIDPRAHGALRRHVRRAAAGQHPGSHAHRSSGTGHCRQQRAERLVHGLRRRPRDCLARVRRFGSRAPVGARGDQHRGCRVHLRPGAGVLHALSRLG